ncbi:MAG: DUF2207 domain-containing protein [Gemmatimonadaceae bacterium]
MGGIWLLLGALLAPVAAAQEKSLRVEEIDAVLEVGADGVLDVTERITVAFKGEWNGVRRDLLLRHNTAQGRSVRLDVDVGEITDSAGRPLTVEEESEDGTLILRIYVPDNRDATRQVVIRYRVSNAIRFFYADSDAGELDELYWNVTGSNWEWPIGRARARVVLPPGVRPTRVAVYTGSEGSTSSAADIDTTGNAITFTTRGELDAYEGMTVGIGWTPGFIASRPSETTHLTREVVRWWPVLLPFLALFLAFRAWKKRGRDPEEGTIAVQYEPFEGMSPAELGTLVDHRAEMRDITATLVDLAVRGFVRIEEQTERKLLGLISDTDFEFFLLKPREEWSGLANHEERYLDALFDGSDSVHLSDLKDKFYTSLPGIRDALYERLVERGHYLKRPDSVKNNWMGGAALALAAGMGGAMLAAGTGSAWFSPVALGMAAVGSALSLFVFGLIMPARTAQGARARGAALGFREFLSRVDSDRYKRMITSPQMFEKFLPYAMAFAVEEKWARAFEDIYREPPGWYTGGTGHFHASSFSARMSALSSTASSTMSSSPSSSGSGGGGSSGGGSGGGGGGGF